MDPITYVGLAAGFFTSFALLPQVVKAVRTRKTRDLSLIMLFVLWMGIVLWLAYGLLLPDLPLALWNAISFVLASTILVLKLKYK